MTKEGILDYQGKRTENNMSKYNRLFFFLLSFLNCLMVEAKIFAV